MKQLKIFTLIFTLIFLPQLSKAINITSKVSEVTLYPTKAQEIRNGKLILSQTGEQELVFNDISRFIDPQSIQVKITGVTILSVTSRINYLGKKTDQTLLKSWKDSLEEVQDQRAWLQEKIAVATGELKLYDQNLSVEGDQTSLFPKAVEDLAVLYKSKTLKIREELFQLKKEDKKLEETIQKLQAQINSAGSNNQPVQEIVVKIYNTKSGQSDYQLSYMVSQVSWRPIYDIHAQNTSDPLKINMKAQITQQTGYDWENVKLNLSTAQPQTNQKMPDWRTEYIDFQQINLYDKAMSAPQMRMESVAKAKSIRADSDGIEDMPVYELTETATAQLYQINRSQTITSGKEAQYVEVSSVDIPASYKYESLPKIDPSVYLVAKVPNWESYNLLNGTANLFFEDTYVGQIYLNAKVVSDTLSLSLGKDELVFIERKSINDFSSKKLIGSTKREDKSFEITVKNNKKSSVEILVYDQIPISRQKDIEVILNSSDKALFNSENGKLEWNVNLKPGESKKIKWDYTIKYPNEKNVVIQ